MTQVDVAQRLQELSVEQKARLFERLRTIQKRPDSVQTTIARQPRLSGDHESNSFPLSYAQQRLWFLDQLEPNQPFYNVPMALRLHGSLDLAALSHSLSYLLARHESLRTTFGLDGTSPLQQIAPPDALLLQPELLDAPDLAGCEQAARAVATAEAQQPFDLACGPLVRFRLLQLDADDHILLITLHHAIVDGWSLGVLLRELAHAYRAFLAGQAPSLPALPIQYADYAVWQRDWLDSGARSRLLEAWKQLLDGAPPLLELPTDFPRPPVQTFHGAQHMITLDPALTDGLRHLSRQTGVSLFMTLLSAFQVLLARYSGQTDLLIGTPIAGRTSTELEGLIGFFANTVVLRGNLEGNPSFLDLLSRTRASTLAAYAQQELPFEQLVEALSPERSLSHAPLFQVMFALQPHQPLDLELPGLRVAPFAIEVASAKFDLTLNMEEESDRLYANLEYNTDLFSPATAERLLGQFQTLLAGVVARPQQTIAVLPLLSAAERGQLLVEWNQTAQDYPRNETLASLFAAQVARTPDAPALV